MTRISPIKLLGLALLAGLTVFSSFAGDFPGNFDSWNSNPQNARNTSLRMASMEGRTSEVTFLLRQGANPNGEGSFGETALIAAARYNQPKTALLLIEAGADPEQRDNKDQTALMAAARFCAPRVGVQIIEARANVNWQDLHGRSALMYASAAGCWQMVEALLKVHNIDVNIRDDEGFTALDLIMEEKNLEVGGPYTDIHQMLIKAGARHSKWVAVDQEPPMPKQNRKPSPEQAPNKLP